MSECQICLKIQEKKAMIVYEDDTFVAILPAKPATTGHLRIMTKNHSQKLDDISHETVQNLFGLANACSSALFDVTKAHGTNVILNESDSHLSVDVLARKDGDGLNFLWPQTHPTPAELDSVFAKIKDNAYLINIKSEQQKPKVEQEKGPEKIKIEPEEDNYFLKNLLGRLP